MPHDTDGPADERCSSCSRLDPSSCPCPPDDAACPDLEDVLLPLATKETLAAVSSVADERIRQVEKWGVQTRPDGTGGDIYKQAAEVSKAHTDAAAADGSLTWVDILMEEIFEALAEDDPVRLREELIQVAAVAVSWSEDIDRKAAS